MLDAFMVHLHLLDTPTIGWWFHRWVWRLLGQHVEPQPIQSCPKMGISVYPKSHDMFFFLECLILRVSMTNIFFLAFCPRIWPQRMGFQRCGGRGVLLKSASSPVFVFLGRWTGRPYRAWSTHDFWNLLNLENDKMISDIPGTKYSLLSAGGSPRPFG